MKTHLSEDTHRELTKENLERQIGAIWQGTTCLFTVWAPYAKEVSVELVGKHDPLPMESGLFGYWKLETEEALPGDKYYYWLDGKEKKPDPASRSQPEGVHGPSEIIDPKFKWGDKKWTGLPMRDMIIYEIHTGTFTSDGNFEGIISKMDYLKSLGINTIELMPVAQFPGSRNWGYDGVYPFAVQHSYGGPAELKKLVNKCHKEGIAVILDVVYNHLGPEGNYLDFYGPYFTDKYKTPWGKAINFDDGQCDHVRNYFIRNALMWLDEFHIDGLRLDAIHAIYDFSAEHIIKQLCERVKALEEKNNRSYVIIGESDLNDTKYIKPIEENGFGLNGQWCDDFHHALHAFLTKEKNGYYKDFGTLNTLQKALNHTFVYDGIYSHYREKIFGNSPNSHTFDQFVVFDQNHDQVGNRMFGDRISNTLDLDHLKLMSAFMLLSPYVPLLFMGEEYGETHPFQYFISHEDEQLIEAVRKGRSSEFASFNWKGKIPDPQSEKTFENCKLSWQYDKKDNKILLDWYKTLIKFRKKHSALQNQQRSNTHAKIDEDRNLLFLTRKGHKKMIRAFFNFSDKAHTITIEEIGVNSEKLLDSAEERWNGSGSKSKVTLANGVHVGLPPTSVSVYESDIS